MTKDMEAEVERYRVIGSGAYHRMTGWKNATYKSSHALSVTWNRLLLLSGKEMWFKSSEIVRMHEGEGDE